jgi:hypothetical protein
MKSPFPGMDPYLEARWSDVHAKLIGFMGEVLQPLLPRDLRARAEERIVLETSEDGGEARAYRADLAVVTGTHRTGATQSATERVATLEPCLVPFEYGPICERWIQIIDRANGNRVVTVIEVLSPWNKGPGRLNADYLRKLDDYAGAGVSLVEIDLLREPGRQRLHIRQDDLPPARRAPYLVCLRRAWRLDTYEVYPLSLRRPLPRVPIPLRRRDADVGLDLQGLIERVYAAGGHDDIDYTQPPRPPLEGADAVWADALLRRAGLRTRSKRGRLRER